jgi:hypothetical protein
LVAAFLAMTTEQAFLDAVMASERVRSAVAGPMAGSPSGVELVAALIEEIVARMSETKSGIC